MKLQTGHLAFNLSHIFQNQEVFLRTQPEFFKSSHIIAHPPTTTHTQQYFCIPGHNFAHPFTPNHIFLHSVMFLHTQLQQTIFF